MPTPGRAVVLETGKRGVLAGGKAAVFNAAGQCAACCGGLEVAVSWSFTDTGFIDGGQDGAYRAYDHPAMVPASPWMLAVDGLGLRLDFEEDLNCRGHNPYTQYATATCQITVNERAILTATWSGMAETERLNRELMVMTLGGNLLGRGSSPGGGLGCEGGMGPALCYPTPPAQATLDPGTYTLHIDATTDDAYFHFGAWYAFEFSFAPA
ncbi:MAG TPA: hypothetical protein ENN87_02475 [Phycisphaerales bacterium]|nr:hypothetical protein [Phycisphaerales bacterium]